MVVCAPLLETADDLLLSKSVPSFPTSAAAGNAFMMVVKMVMMAVVVMMVVAVMMVMAAMMVVVVIIVEVGGREREVGRIPLDSFGA